ncbi:MAG TPA: hypothetical protein VIY69_00740 [Candidatus Acidoferrales bacterium]
MAFDAGSHAEATVVRFDANDAAVTADMDVTGKSDLLREGENKFDGTASGGLGVCEEKQAAVTDVARFAVFFDDAGAIWIAQAHGKHH